MTSTDRPLPTYEHSQVGTVILASTVIGLMGAAVAVAFVVRDPHLVAAGKTGLTLVPGVIVLILTVATVVLFSRLTVRVDGSQLSWWFGPGIIRKSVPVSEIVDATPVRNAWWYGWGIHLTPRGWLYNVSGLDGVEITLRSGRRFRLGTDEPDRLTRVILDRRITASPPATVR